MITIFSQGISQNDTIYSLGKRLIFACYAIIADRYLYLSYVGIAFLIAYGIHIVWEKHKKRFQCLACIFLLIYSLYFSTYTYLYAQKWENTSSVKKYIKELIEQRDKEKEIK